MTKHFHVSVRLDWDEPYKESEIEYYEGDASIYEYETISYLKDDFIWWDHFKNNYNIENVGYHVDVKVEKF